jgi:hypothetical protein
VITRVTAGAAEEASEPTEQRVPGKVNIEEQGLREVEDEATVSVAGHDGEGIPGRARQLVEPGIANDVRA